jgi:hypothetical protein
MAFSRLGGLRGRGLSGVRGYFNAAGFHITTAQVGDTITYNVPGQPAGTIWLEQYVNGALGYNGPFTIPMSPYTLSGKDQLGNWLSYAYTYAGGKKGDLLEYSTLYVMTPQQAVAPGPGFVPSSTTTTPVGSPSSGGGGGGGSSMPPPVTIATAPSIPGALPSGGTVGASYNSGNCLTGKYRFILATGGGFATGASLPGCSETNSANCDPQFFSTLSDAIHYALSRSETPYKVDSAAEPWQLLSCAIPLDPGKVYNSDGSLGSGLFGGFSMTTILIVGAVAYTLLRRKSS